MKATPMLERCDHINAEIRGYPDMDDITGKITWREETICHDCNSILPSTTYDQIGGDCEKELDNA